ncbi:hypothetical protein BD289DRAFT_434946 [Coniella lustricola]|uniref:Secreted protein n=1 Tax=Coniella lustricola TaxID=2025994 RepID=A0A2T3A704_9PEZI|nr:hypothetical protein BD289DRAFT_434946 [Coniella lustricola]
MWSFARISKAVAGLVLLARSVTAATYVGGVDMQAACQEQYANSSEQGILTGSSAYDWVCYNPSTGASGSVDVNEYCQYTYGGSAYADPQGGGAYDWGCYVP